MDSGIDRLRKIPSIGVGGSQDHFKRLSTLNIRLQ